MSVELLESKLAYEGYGVDVEIRRYRRADGTEVERQVIDHPGSVAILAHDDEFVYLVSQPREAVEEDALLEIPAGTLDRDGETELECARRELAEEAELAAAEWTELTKIYRAPATSPSSSPSSSPPTSPRQPASATPTRRSTSSAYPSPTSTRRCRESATPPR